ncbi:MAG: hypothetical protein ABJC89_24680 [Acidobacteriota bacterium]
MSVAYYALVNVSDHKARGDRCLPDASPDRRHPNIGAARLVVAVDFAALLESGQLTRNVARTLPLDEVVAAMKSIEDTRVAGRTVITPCDARDFAVGSRPH